MGEVKRFGRTEQRINEFVWSIYEAENDGDYRGGIRVASFLRREDALTFIDNKIAALESELADTKICKKCGRKMEPAYCEKCDATLTPAQDTALKEYFLKADEELRKEGAEKAETALTDYKRQLTEEKGALNLAEMEVERLRSKLAEVHRLAHDRPTKDILPIIHKITEPFHIHALAAVDADKEEVEDEKCE